MKGILGRIPIKLYLVALVLAGGIVVGMEVLTEVVTGGHGAIAQIIRSDDAWKKVYEQLPDFPKENQYLNKETKKVAEDDTLVGRLIRYHLYVKGRIPFYRLDWKLTLADYLEIYGRMDENNYPSGNKLNKNPLAGDIAAIQKLNLAQRNALVQALVNAFATQLPRK
ncbi:hypothetical protein [Leptodesmis sp.]|uniref:hypothetical protein n=1 Tax=Leptodesmis sp. TaxID=3100501 RepID=UPI00405345EC